MEQNTKLSSKFGLGISLLSLLFALSATVLSCFPESHVSSLIAHPIDGIKVAFLCLNHASGERVGDIFCGIDGKR